MSRSRGSPSSDTIVGATSLRSTNPARRVLADDRSPDGTPGACTATLGEDAAARARGADQHHRVVLEVDVGQQRADELVGASQRAPELDGRLVGRGRLPEHLGPHEVGSLDEHDRTGLPHRPERVDDRCVVVAHAER